MLDGFTEWPRIERIEKEKRLMTELLPPPPKKKRRRKSSAVNHLRGVDTSAGHTQKDFVHATHRLHSVSSQGVCCRLFRRGSTEHGTQQGVVMTHCVAGSRPTVTLLSLCLPAVHCPGFNTSAHQTLEHRGFKGRSDSRPQFADTIFNSGNSGGRCAPDT